MKRENLELGAPSEVANPALDSVDDAERFRNFWVAVLCFLGFYVEKPTKAPSPGRFRKSGEDTQIRNQKNSKIGNGSYNKNDDLSQTSVLDSLYSSQKRP
jgi:hypothetical protein